MKPLIDPSTKQVKSCPQCGSGKVRLSRAYLNNNRFYCWECGYLWFEVLRPSMLNFDAPIKISLLSP